MYSSLTRRVWHAGFAMSLALPFLLSPSPVSAKGAFAHVAMAKAQSAPAVNGVEKVSATMVNIRLQNGQTRILDFYGDRIFRVYQDPKGRAMHDPEAKPEAKILVSNPKTALRQLLVEQTPDAATIKTSAIEINVNKGSGLMQVRDLKTGRIAISELKVPSFGKDGVELTLQSRPDEYFFGGGVQNGRFSHKGKIISIVNQNSWTDGGVASPNPFYWSTGGYAVMFHTFKPGSYDFGATKATQVTLKHEADYLDAFFMIDNGSTALLNDYYQLTGRPALLPKFGFYEGHLNAYNRDYWKETDKGGILFEDGKRYTESQKDNGGIKESLNGEKQNYQFSARAVIDRYANHDMPLGWILPNDGYGAGYGQEKTLDGNIQNLKEFGDYARSHGVQIGLWTQSDLHPVDSIPALLQRDIDKEIGTARVRVLKTDVAWVGAGYSFGLNGISDVATLMPKYGNGARPFIITLDGWAGTQRYAGVWTGDQTGGKWEYIRFHIPTYIGAGLSGMPNIGSDMDGIFGGRQGIINTRDFEWKTFTPMQLNMDGWGSNEKYPQALGEPYTSINRNYLKFKSELMPYIYSVAKTSVDSLPMIRAMFLSDPNRYTLGKATQYQYLFGPWFLVAPVYKETAADKNGNDIRNNIYLPHGQWIDYFTGETYEGGVILNNFQTPLWKLPLFVKTGAIIPETKANNNVTQMPADLRMFELYPDGHSEFTLYDDDGTTEKYLQGEYQTTRIVSDVEKQKLTVTIEPARGTFSGMVKEKQTLLIINVTQKPKKVSAKTGKKSIKLHEAASLQAFESSDNVYYYNATPELNKYSTAGSDASKISVKKNPQLLVKLGKSDITLASTTVGVKGFVFNKQNSLAKTAGPLAKPANVRVEENDRKAYSLTPSWNSVSGADYYEILYDSMLYTGIRNNRLEFEDLQPETNYSFQVRAVNKSGHSEWALLNTKTNVNPLEFAIKGATATCSAPSQPGEGLNRLFDFKEDNMWHTQYGKAAVPFDLVVDMHAVSKLDRMDYLPRQVGVNGMITSGTVYTSMDKTNWTKAGDFNWTRDMETKIFRFEGQPQARYIKITVKTAYGNYGSGRELYIFKVPGSESYIPGDINNDHVLDRNDITSYMNYTGLRLGDKDFEGYVSKGDINGNHLIDAYDISNVAVAIEGGARPETTEPVDGKLVLIPNKKNYRAGETVELTVRGFGLKHVNALSFALPYSTNEYEYLGLDMKAAKTMENFTNDRLHSNGTRALYPTLVNIGDQPEINGTQELFVLRFKALRNGPFTLKMADGLLVDKNLVSKAL